MAKSEYVFSITPSDAIGRIEPVMLEEAAETKDDRVRNAELLDSVLLITSLDHNSEAALVRQAVVNALGRLPDAPK
jgi:hypothetical protein